MKRIARNRNRSRGHARLLRRAARDWHAPRGWRSIEELQRRGSFSMLARLASLADSPNARHRAVALSVAAQLMRRVDGEWTPFAEDETQRLLLQGLSDPHPDVVRAAVAGLGHRPHGASVDALLRLATHRDERMRWQVAVALGSYEEPEAIAGLIALSTDPSDEVRDWATFGLGTLRMDDTPEIRAALRRNLDDIDEDVRGEALVGLARRHDEGIVERLMARLTPDCHLYELDAAVALADPRLLAPLQTLEALARERGVRDDYWWEELREAVAASGATGSDF
ncbi:HEAT repeat domain-containing protein [Roseateles chitosanitabidus]|uniref:HEAT repeat domain-containing protein n=1 Tax=Roseateles chitosanitabidus TaxID=65048 RepID=UPI000830BE9D|nr:HEAT repeat domain-containing protein [Roseateles chitosanitabidus]